MRLVPGIPSDPDTGIDIAGCDLKLGCEDEHERLR